MADEVSDKRLVIELNNVFMRSDRGDQLFKDLNFQLEAGRTAVITGAAGSGKSSFIDLLIGERIPDEGSVMVAGEYLKRRRRIIRKVRRKIGGVGGTFSLVPSFTVAENIPSKSEFSDHNCQY